MSIEIKTDVVLTCDECGRYVTFKESGANSLQRIITKAIQLGWMRISKPSKIESYFICSTCAERFNKEDSK